MSPKVRLAIIAGSAIGVAVLGYVSYERFYAKPAAELRKTIATAKGNKNGYETALLEEGRVRRELSEIIASAVHGDRESLEHRLRTASATLAFEAGLTRLEVNSLPPRSLGNPAATARGVKERAFQRTLRDRIDASEARVVVSGEGSLENVMRALALAESQRWTLGVESWSIKPQRVEEGKPAVFTLSMTITALLVSDEGSLAGEIPIDPLGEAEQQRVAMVVGADPFRSALKPQPVVVAAPPPPPDPKPAPPPPPPAGDGWKLVGIIEGTSGQYAIVVHQNGRRRTLSLGEEISGLRLAAIGGDAATFETSEQRYEVRNGEPLAASGRRDRR
ncbi:MAG: hypothetical protein ACIAQU_07010 [Phycisphaerales bacterium JB064]